MKKIILILLISTTHVCFAQTIFKNERFGFSMEQPENWNTAKQGQTLENIKTHIQLNTETINKLIEENKGTIQIVAFYKYPIETTRGLIPTIKVNLTKNSTPSFEAFQKEIEKNLYSLKQIFPDFKFLASPIKVKISELDCLKVTCTYTVKAKADEEKIRTTVYAVPIKNKFYQITFMDSEKENNAELYDKLVKTIAIY